MKSVSSVVQFFSKAKDLVIKVCDTLTLQFRNCDQGRGEPQSSVRVPWPGTLRFGTWYHAHSTVRHRPDFPTCSSRAQCRNCDRGRSALQSSVRSWEYHDHVRCASARDTMRTARYDIVLTFRRDSQNVTMKSSTVQGMVQWRPSSLVREYAGVIGKQASCFVVFQLVTLIEWVFFV